MLPNFLIIGAPKTGTTSLYHYLRSHPRIFLSEAKELDFFVERLNWPRGVEWYERQFSGAAGAIAVGEASPRYSMYPHHSGVVERVAALLPDAKLIYIVRDPIERMISNYQHRARRGAERRPLADALLSDPYYLDPSRYFMQIQQYLRYYQPEHLLVVQSERLATNREAEVARVCEFLGVPADVDMRLLQQEHNVTRNAVTPRRFVAPVMQHRWWTPVVQRAPASLKRAGKRLTHRPPRRGILPPACTDELRARLRDDVAELRAFVETEFDGWGIA
jgi:hypothetical protein